VELYNEFISTKILHPLFECSLFKHCSKARHTVLGFAVNQISQELHILVSEVQQIFRISDEGMAILIVKLI